MAKRTAKKRNAKRRGAKRPPRNAARKPAKKPAAKIVRAKAKSIDGDPPRDLNGYDPIATAGDCWFDREAAERVVKFAEKLCVHVEGPLAGQALVLEPWQRDIYLTLFGWKRKDGSRRYRKAFITVARKNSKTTSIDAPIALYMTGYDGEARAQNYVISSKKDQAALLWSIAAEMIKLSPALKSVFECIDSSRRILHYATGSFFGALPNDPKGAHGTNPYLVINDETHVTPAELIDTLETGFGARTNPLLLFTTTAGDDKASEWWRLLEYSRKIVAGSQASAADRRRDPRFADDWAFLPVLYEVPEEADWTKRDVWKLANPNLGKSIQVRTVEQECLEAQASPLKESTFRRLRLNQFVEKQTKPIKMADWDACYLPAKEWPDLRGRECFGGLDLASSQDLAAFALVWPIDGRLYVRVNCFWPPRSAADAEKICKVPLQRWIADGYLIASDQEPFYLDYNLVMATIREAHDSYALREVGFDICQANHVANELNAYGIKMQQVKQTTLGLNEATRIFCERVSKHEIVHDGNPVVTWCADNFQVIRSRDGLIRPIKPTLPGSERTEDRSRKIDAIAAAINAISLTLAPEAAEEFVYDKRGMWTSDDFDLTESNDGPS